jgi:hypothetical protein
MHRPRNVNRSNSGHSFRSIDVAAVAWPLSVKTPPTHLVTTIRRKLNRDSRLIPGTLFLASRRSRPCDSNLPRQSDHEGPRLGVDARKCGTTRKAVITSEGLNVRTDILEGTARPDFPPGARRRFWLSAGLEINYQV